MKFLAKISAEWPLRLGLGAMYLYSGIDIIRHPTGWYWAIRPLPAAIQAVINNQIGIDRYLMIQGLGELFLGVLLLAWFLPRKLLRLAAALIAVEMGAILIFVGVDAVTFRDIGLLGAAAALFIVSRPTGG